MINTVSKAGLAQVESARSRTFPGGRPHSTRTYGGRMARGTGAARRWGLVLALVAVLAAAPAVVAAWPAADADRSAVDLRAAAIASESVRFSGYAESMGALALPETDELDNVADLFSSRTTMRVWWRGPTDSRVDVVTAGGETGVYRDASGSVTWEYERNRVTRTPAAPLALPEAPDLLPNTLSRRLLAEAEPGELSRIDAERIAGRDALGLRVVPADAASSIARVDIWVDAATGLPLQLRLVGKGAANPALETRYVDVEFAPPDASITAFTPPDGARLRQGDDLAALRTAGRGLPPIAFPSTLAGLPRRSIEGAPPEIALYGRGVTLLAVVPVPTRLGRDLQRATERNITAVRDDVGTRISAGPIGILLSARPAGRRTRSPARSRPRGSRRPPRSCPTAAVGDDRDHRHRDAGTHQAVRPDPRRRRHRPARAGG